MNLIECLDEARTRWNLLEHPFYRRWERGELTTPELAFYAGEYRHAVVALARTAAVGGSPAHAREEAAHVALWDEFAAALDAPLDRPPTPETQACADAWTASEPIEAASIMYAVEAGQPDIAATKLAGLTEHYGFEDSAPGTAYFSVHSQRDHAHAREARGLLEASASPADTERLVGAGERALEANWKLLDAVEAYSGVT